MKKFKVIQEFYLTFLTLQDSYMQKISIDEFVYTDDKYINVYYNDKESIDYYCYIHQYLEELDSCQSGNGESS